jgi:cob(I)alamin adenosyltransferase
MKIYTKSGDKGETSLFDGSRVSKANERIELLGELDELNARIGILCSTLTPPTIDEKSPSFSKRGWPKGPGAFVDFNDLEFLQKLQSLLLDLGSEIANPKISSEKVKDFSEYVLEMENKMDEMDKELDELKNFILPGGSIQSANAHLCRTQTRRAERKLIELQIINDKLQMNESSKQFLNRMSDYFFVLARYLNKINSAEDIVWKN